MSKKELWDTFVNQAVLSDTKLITSKKPDTFSMANRQIDAYRYMMQQLPPSKVPVNQPAAHPMLVFNQFDQYVLSTEDGWSINGLSTPCRYQPNTYGFCKATGVWYKLVLYRSNSGNPMRQDGPWRHKWEAIKTSLVPKPHQAACVLMVGLLE